MSMRKRSWHSAFPLFPAWLKFRCMDRRNMPCASVQTWGSWLRADWESMNCSRPLLKPMSINPSGHSMAFAKPSPSRTTASCPMPQLIARLSLHGGMARRSGWKMSPPRSTVSKTTRSPAGTWTNAPSSWRSSGSRVPIRSKPSIRSRRSCRRSKPSCRQRST